MKIVSTTGQVLLEKNIDQDLHFSDPTDEIVSISSNPNPDEMFIAILTKNGRIIKYSVRLEK
jgi:hypothetical protein